MLKCGILINNINRHGFTKSACILNFDNDLYIVTSNYSYSEVPEPIRLYNMEGYKLKKSIIKLTKLIL
jgi:hypothetical protein